jgi:hypothetical protein
MFEDVRVIKDSKILKPNNEHQNFTETTEEFKTGDILTGRFADIDGKRRGKPFNYRIFITKDKKIIYQNNVERMKTTEVMLGADSAQTPTVIDLTKAEAFSKDKTRGLLIGGAAGFAFSKYYKKHDWKKVAMWTAIGAGLGYATAYLMPKKITVTESK